MLFALWTHVGPSKHVFGRCILASTSELSVFSVSAKPAEQMEMVFGVWTWVSRRNYVLDGVQIAQCQGAIFRGKNCPGMPTQRHAQARLRSLCCELCNKCSAAAEMGDHLATIDMVPKRGVVVCPFRGQGSCIPI